MKNKLTDKEMKEFDIFCCKEQIDLIIKLFLKDLDDINQDNRADYLIEKYNKLLN